LIAVRIAAAKARATGDDGRTAGSDDSEQSSHEQSRRWGSAAKRRLLESPWNSALLRLEGVAR
jgi:hypothetical protein